MPGLHSNRGAKRAREARHDLGLDPAAPLPCLLDVVERGAGLPVVVASLPDGVAGACHRGAGGAVLWVNGRQFRPRQRFTLAHELAHAWCGHDGHETVDSVATLGGTTSDPVEIQANAFAAEFLVPRAAMQQLVVGPPSLDEVVTIATAFGVSAIVVLYRLKELRLVAAPRAAQLQAEIDERLHEDAFARLGLAPLEDRLGTLEHLPYLSPALDGSLLAAGLRGEAAVDAGLAGAVRRLLG
jgi:Zn-dependent peptidase ImmA (M78 family)